MVIWCRFWETRDSLWPSSPKTEGTVGGGHGSSQAQAQLSYQLTVWPQGLAPFSGPPFSVQKERGNDL